MLRVIRELVATATVVKCNEGEALRLGRKERVEDAAAAMCADGPEAVVVTLGERGALVASADGVEPVKGVEAEVVDATGAGDSVAGVLAAGLALGAEPGGLTPVVEVAMPAAASVVGAWGATEGLPPASEARARLAAALN